MVADIPYKVINDVVSSWEQLRRIKNYREKVGVELFRIFFHMEPGATHVFGLDSKDVYNEDFLQNPRLRHHAAVFMLMFDRAVNLLGPDFDLLTDILVTLGERHYHMGVQIAYYPKMGLAMLQVLEMFLGNKFTPAVKASWVVTYQSLSVDMMRFSKRVLLN